MNIRTDRNETHAALYVAVDKLAEGADTQTLRDAYRGARKASALQGWTPAAFETRVHELVEINPGPKDFIVAAWLVTIEAALNPIAPAPHVLSVEDREFCAIMADGHM